MSVLLRKVPIRKKSANLFNDRRNNNNNNYDNMKQMGHLNSGLCTC